MNQILFILEYWFQARNLICSRGELELFYHLVSGIERACVLNCQHGQTEEANLLRAQNAKSCKTSYNSSSQRWWGWGVRAVMLILPAPRRCKNAVLIFFTRDCFCRNLKGQIVVGYYYLLKQSLGVPSKKDVQGPLGTNDGIAQPNLLAWKYLYSPRIERNHGQCLLVLTRPC